MSKASQKEANQGGSAKRGGSAREKPEGPMKADFFDTYVTYPC